MTQGMETLVEMSAYRNKSHGDSQILNADYFRETVESKMVVGRRSRKKQPEVDYG